MSFFFQFCSDDTANSLIDLFLLSGVYRAVGLYHVLTEPVSALFLSLIMITNDDSFALRSSAVGASSSAACHSMPGRRASVQLAADGYPRELFLYLLCRLALMICLKLQHLVNGILRK